jgi:hypothetical protein
VAKEHQRAERTAQLDTLAGLLDKAETALDGGHLAETHQHLVAIDEMLHGGASDAALRARIDSVQARYAQLKGWQHWAGGLARDELTQQAEALAAVAGGPPEARTVKLSIKQQAEVIQDMRNRWKELDHLGGATSRALWQRFDTALKAAYEPVAAHLKVLQDQREQNLLARQRPGTDPGRSRPARPGCRTPATTRAAGAPWPKRWNTISPNGASSALWNTPCRARRSRPC